MTLGLYFEINGNNLKNTQLMCLLGVFQLEQRKIKIASDMWILMWLISLHMLLIQNKVFNLRRSHIWKVDFKAS